MNKKERMYQQIEKHGNDLKAIFNLPTDTDAIKLCKKLHTIEAKAHHAATCLLNTNTLNLLELNRFTGYDVKQATEEEQEKFFGTILDKVDKLLNFRAQNIPVFINYDARGYTLKIKSEYIANITERIERDMGGYGILVPEFDGN